MGEKGCIGMTKILLVEDSKFLRLATERALARTGYEVSSAADGDEALSMARTKLPDLILLDMLLPKTSGLDVLKSLKKDPLHQVDSRSSHDRHDPEERPPSAGRWSGGIPGKIVPRVG